MKTYLKNKKVELESNTIINLKKVFIKLKMLKKKNIYLYHHSCFTRIYLLLVCEDSL